MFVRVDYKLYIGNPGGGCYTVCPAKLEKPKDRWDNGIRENYEQMFSFYDDPLIFLQPLLIKYFDKDIPYDYFREWTEEVEFEIYGENLYTYSTWNKLLNELNDMKKNYPKLPKKKKRWIYLWTT